MTDVSKSMSSWPILVVLGPTASGKSTLAMQIAKTCSARILSVDSMQVYRGMDIGTAKPTPAEQREIVHYGIDVVDPDQTFTTAKFVELADQAIAQANQHDAPLIATGGTPLYYKALFQGLFDGPGEDAALRQKLSLLPLDQLHEQLRKADPQAALRIHRNDLRRTVRALEVHALTGKPISSFQTAWEQPPQRHHAIWLGLAWERDAINMRINARVKAMMEAGWMDETGQLLHRYGTLSRTAVDATGYRQLIDHLQGRTSLDAAVESIKIATRQLARRQMKWFRRFEHVHWLDGALPLEELTARALSLWQTSRTRTNP